MKILNNVEMKSAYAEYTKAIFSFFNIPDKEKPDEINLCIQPTTCTDYLTDKLMYPNKDIGVITYEKPDFSACNLAVCFKNKAHTDNFIQYGLPMIYKIERINRFKPTKIVRDENKVFFYASKQWLRSTLHLSLYTKLIRTFSCLTKAYKTVGELAKSGVGYDYMDLYNPLLLKIVYSGKLSKVNAYCRYKHGYTKANDGNHSNNGIKSSIRYAALYKDPTKINAWEPYLKKQVANFKRGANINKLEEQLKDFDTNALPCM